MVVIVDANILISSASNPTGNLARLIFNYSSLVSFVSPEFVLTESKANEYKICTIAKISREQFNSNLHVLLSHLLILNDDEIEERYFKKAYELTESIDLYDMIYVAFALALDALLWTGDLKLFRGLRRKGFNNIVTTKEMNQIIKGL
jgi:predicted nucleic acid-binding protein